MGMIATRPLVDKADADHREPGPQGTVLHDDPVSHGPDKGDDLIGNLTALQNFFRNIR